MIEYTITANMTAEDATELSELAHECGMTVGELISSMIGDLIDGSQSNGSDERGLMRDWLSRTGHLRNEQYSGEDETMRASS